MADSLDKLTAATGLRRDSLLGIWEEVKANHARLDACPRHDFPEPEPMALSTRYECRNCRGWTDGSSVRWYRLGLQHGAGNG
jgi:hypothetical protein